MKQCKHNRILSVLLALVMVFSMVPMTAYAGSVDPISDDIIPDGVKTISEAYEIADDTENVSVIGQVVYRFGKNGTPTDTILEDVINGQIYGLQVYNKCDGCEVGDVVVVTGTINSYGGVKQLTSVTGRIRVIENREPIAAQEVTISQLGNDYLSEYIYIKDITMGTYSTSNTPVNDASGSINIFQAASLPSGVSNGDIKGVYACFSVYNTTKQLRNGSSDDYVINATVTAPSITKQPSDAEVDNGETATFTVVASGLNLSYQWKINRDDGSGWNDISGANAASYTTSTVDADCDGYRYKCVVSNSGGDVESNTVTLNIKKYTVSFDAKGGAETIAPQEVVRGGKASTPTPPTKTGYVFDGWYSSDTYNAGSKWDFASNTVSTNTTLLAKWLSTDAGITAVSLNGTAGTINGTDIVVVLPYGSAIPTDASAVSVTTVTGAIASTPVTADTGSTWTFTVTAEDGITTKNYTVNVSVAANPAVGNQADVDAAKSVIENFTWTVAQGTANSKDDIKTWIEQQLAGMNLNGATYTVNVSDSFTAAIAGTASDADGTNGSFSFTVSLSKGENTGNAATSTYASATASVTSGTITATTYSSGGSDNPGSGDSDNPGDSGSDDSNTPDNSEVTYEILNGANSSWTLGSSEGLTIRGAGEFSKFTGVKVDGNLLDQNNYTAKEGSTIITLKASYLNTLGAGSHTAQILWTDGSAGTTFTINANTSGKKDNVPKTGDNTPVAWLFILAGLSGAGLVLTGRKGRKNLETLRK